MRNALSRYSDYRPGLDEIDERRKSKDNLPSSVSAGGFA
jgi:hypothetical protein